MIIKLQGAWFAPSQMEKHDGERVFSGAYYKAGEHNVPDYFKNYLPPSAIIVKEDVQYEAPDIDHSDTLGAFDMARGAAEVEAEVHRVAEETRTGKPGPKVVRK